MTHVKVEVAVAIEVGERRRGRPIAVAAQTGRRGDILERSVAPVMEESVATPAGAEDVRVAVVVVVADGHAVAISQRQGGDARAFGLVLEGAVAPVSEEPIAGARRAGPR